MTEVACLQRELAGAGYIAERSLVTALLLMLDLGGIRPRAHRGKAVVSFLSPDVVAVHLVFHDVVGDAQVSGARASRRHGVRIRRCCNGIRRAPSR